MNEEKTQAHTYETCIWFEPTDDGWGFCDEKEAHTREDCRCPAWEACSWEKEGRY